MENIRKHWGKIAAFGKKVCRLLFWPLWSVNILLALWCCGAIWYPHWIGGNAVKAALIVLYLMVALVSQIISIRWRRIVWLNPLLFCGIAAAWLNLLRPSGALDWDPPFAKPYKARFSADGKSVTIENIRDFHYRTELDYDVRYRTETYRFEDIRTMDYSITHWNGSELFGHIMLIFGFKDGRYLVFSPEARMERGKLYEILPGMFRRYELIFIVATERDAVQLRTHHRKYEQEEVFLYPTNTQPEVAAFLLRDLLERGNRLPEKPEYYNGFTYNCLSSMAPSAEKLGFDFCCTWRGAVNGISDAYGYRTGWLRRSRADESFSDYKKRHSVNQYVEHLKDPEDFSRRIRPDQFPLRCPRGSSERASVMQ